MEGWLGLVPGLVRWFVVLVGVLTIGGYAVVGCAVNKQPSVQRFDGWIALVQRTDDLSTARAVLSGRATVPAGVEGPSSVSVTVRACGGAFNGLLLLGGSARLDSLHVLDERGGKPGRARPRAWLSVRQVGCGTSVWCNRYRSRSVRWTVSRTPSGSWPAKQCR